MTLLAEKKRSITKLIVMLSLHNVKNTERHIETNSVKLTRNIKKQIKTRLQNAEMLMSRVTYVEIHTHNVTKPVMNDQNSIKAH